MSEGRDPFYDDGEIAEELPQPEESADDPSPTVVEVEEPLLSTDVQQSEVPVDPTVIPRSPSPPPPAPAVIVATQSEPIEDEIPKKRSASSNSTSTYSFESDEDTVKKEAVPHRSMTDIDTQTDQVSIHDRSIQTDTIAIESLSTGESHRLATLSEFKTQTIPLVRTILDQPVSFASPIVGFCQPCSITSRMNDVILALPHHLMIVHNQNSVTVHPWQPQQQQHRQSSSSSTILDCFWCSFLYKLLVTTLEDNRLCVYDFTSVVDSIKLRGDPLTIKHHSSPSPGTRSSLRLSSSLRHATLSTPSSQTRFTKSNSLGIFYCYISDRHNSCMLTRIDHNTRQHVTAIDCSAGSSGQSKPSICAMDLSDDRVAIALTNLTMTLYDAETLRGLKQINLSRWHRCNILSVSALTYLWRTWLVFDPLQNQVIGIGSPKRQFVKMLPDHPINACSLADGSLALWLGYPGALFFYRSVA